MTRQEAELLAEVFLTADGGCYGCIRSICEEANDKRLGWSWTVHEHETDPLGDYRITVEDMTNDHRSAQQD